jgi:hypothetical protein
VRVLYQLSPTVPRVPFDLCTIRGIFQNTDIAIVDTIEDNICTGFFIVSLTGPWLFLQRVHLPNPHCVIDCNISWLVYAFLNE